eukprot:6890257-Lingulodinium_polyedra.AAC.1
MPLLGRPCRDRDIHPDQEMVAARERDVNAPVDLRTVPHGEPGLRDQDEIDPALIAPGADENNL